MSVIRGLRRAAIIAIVISLAVAALIGIVAVLTGGFGDEQFKVTLSTLLLATFSITSLCHLAVVAGPLRVVGWIGIAASFIAVVSGSWLIWRPWDGWDDWTGLMLNTMFVSLILAVSLAHANLLLLLGERRNPAIRIGLYATLVFVAVLAALIAVPIVTNEGIPGENGDLYWRAVTVVAILDVLGTIVVPVLSRFVRDDGAPAARPETLRIELDADAAARLDRIAASRGLSRNAVVAEAIASLEE